MKEMKLLVRQSQTPFGEWWKGSKCKVRPNGAAVLFENKSVFKREINSRQRSHSNPLPSLRSLV